MNDQLNDNNQRYLESLIEIYRDFSNKKLNIVYKLMKDFH